MSYSRADFVLGLNIRVSEIWIFGVHWTNDFGGKAWGFQGFLFWFGSGWDKSKKLNCQALVPSPVPSGPNPIPNQSKIRIQVQLGLG